MYTSQMARFYVGKFCKSDFYFGDHDGSYVKVSRMVVISSLIEKNVRRLHLIELELIGDRPGIFIPTLS